MNNHPPLRRWCVLILLVASAPLVSADGLPLPSYQWPDFVGSANCAACHTGLQDAARNDVSIDTHWRSTMMANSARDPFWQAKVASEVSRNPHLQSVIEAKCATCHMPSARTQALGLSLPVAISGSGFLDPANALHSVAMDGVSCALCHQIADQALGQSESFSGGYTVDTTTASPDRLIYGPFPSPFTAQMRNNVGFTPVQGMHATNSALCGVCHNLWTPYVDAEGIVRGEFPEQMIYSEWEQSQYRRAPNARQCQDCHMPPAVGGVKLSNRGGPGLNMPARSPFGQHFFVGANTLLLDLFTNQIAPLALTASSAHFSATRQRAIAQLEQQTARLMVAEIGVGSNELAVALVVSNLAGHKLPSGFPSRRAWLHVWISDGQGAVFFESGRPAPDGSIAGNDADVDPARCEPHRQVIDQPGQVQIYEAIMQDTGAAITHTLLRAASYRKDNRLLPAGFDKTTAGPEIVPTADPAADADFQGGSDRLTYRVKTAGHPGPFVVRAELLYQTLARGFADDLFRDTGSAAASFQAMFDAADRTPVAIAQAAANVDPAAAARIGSPEPLADGSVRLPVFAPISSTNRVETAADFTRWTTLATLVQTSNPSYFLDPSSSNAAARFYRLRAP
ncbi:MAG TPA: hypothetical protein P5555_18040 [Candidatus Paceibacterota bacterium]|nr:hypothetical protein [Verrucomicrobiota bacterium]HRZ47083.1 hypothetical protein [Candidatus Paceibacterota bacterium]HRZ92674.1 hypothetical protein [Candidatus Paceibacterota bacterium]